MNYTTISKFDLAKTLDNIQWGQDNILLVNVFIHTSIHNQNPIAIELFETIGRCSAQVYELFSSGTEELAQQFYDIVPLNDNYGWFKVKFNPRGIGRDEPSVTILEVIPNIEMYDLTEMHNLSGFKKCPSNETPFADIFSPDKTSIFK